MRRTDAVKADDPVAANVRRPRSSKKRLATASLRDGADFLRPDLARLSAGTSARTTRIKKPHIL